MSPPALADTLDRILAHTARVNPSLRRNLRQGLTITQIQDITRDFPYRLPSEVEALYQWHDGMVDAALDDFLFHYHAFLPLHKALEERQQLISWGVLGVDYPNIIPALLPLFTFEGEFYCAHCCPEAQDTAPIFFVYHGETKAYDSLTTMLSAILECYDTGAYQPAIADGIVTTVVDEPRVADIKLRWNPLRRDRYQQALGEGCFYDHP